MQIRFGHRLDFQHANRRRSRAQPDVLDGHYVGVDH